MVQRRSRPASTKNSRKSSTVATPPDRYDSIRRSKKRKLNSSGKFTSMFTSHHPSWGNSTLGKWGTSKKAKRWTTLNSSALSSAKHSIMHSNRNTKTILNELSWAASKRRKGKRSRSKRRKGDMLNSFALDTSMIDKDLLSAALKQPIDSSFLQNYINKQQR